MNKDFNINDEDHESDWKDLTIMRLLSDVADLEDKIDKAIEYIEQKKLQPRLRTANTYSLQERQLLDILKGEENGI